VTLLRRWDHLSVKLSPREASLTDSSRGRDTPLT